MLSADEMSGGTMHWVFEHPRSRLYTYLSISIPSGICIYVHQWLKDVRV